MLLLFGSVIRIWKSKEMIQRGVSLFGQDITAIILALNGRLDIGLARHGSL
jgi:hypothetical protein